MTALVVLVIGLTDESRNCRSRRVGCNRQQRGDRLARLPLYSILHLVAALGLIVAIEAIVLLPSHANLFHGMLVISPLNSLFQIVCLVLAFFTVLLRVP